MADMTETPSLAPPSAVAATNPIILRAPSKYLADPSKPATTTASEPFNPPPSQWLWGTWAVTHSTLSMWKPSQNVRITYTPQKDDESVFDNLVEYEKKNGKGGVKSVLGTEKPDPKVPSAWNWRGKGWLAIASSHWEVLGWGDRTLPNGDVERWAVTWFAATLFSEEGVDVYCDRREGLSKGTADDIIRTLKELEAPKLVQKVQNKMMEVVISLPWKESKK
ncbi:hypothetical protein F5Y18DRAFT_99330 [Xylariaceae sp. FL1019]|nr:hypothetical protein F5Y18DRAFT_99330 [Xylariaceae sp. FL1019]